MQHILVVMAEIQKIVEMLPGEIAVKEGMA
jgi:hypothetical protein